MIIYLLRHGTTQYNVEKRYQGQRDIPLSEEGRARVRRADFTTDVVYVSPLTRARQTAQIARRVLGGAAPACPVNGEA